MDIKVLLHTDQTLEQWNPYLKSQFPIDAHLIVEQIFPALRVDPLDNLLVSRQQLFTAEAFVDTVVKPHPRLAAVELVKMRRRYALGGCAAEFVKVEIGGRVMHTVSVESADSRAVLRTVRELEIGGYPNINYVRQIKSILGCA